MRNVINTWRIVREVSPGAVRRDAERRFLIGLVGTPDEIQRLTRALTGGNREASAYLRPIALPEPDLAGRLRDVDAIISYSDHAPLLQEVRQPVFFADRGIGEQVPAILDALPHLLLALPRRFPIFRAEAARRLVMETAKVNAKIALASAVPGIAPVTGVFLPATSLADMVVLTKNQVLLLLKIAAVYGRPINLRDRLRELLPVVGGGFGWRALARELTGAVPGGAGVLVKGSVAYGGTYAVGRAAILYFEGRSPAQDDTPESF